MKYTLTIDGRPVSTEGRFEVLNPADGSVVANCPAASTDHGRVDPRHRRPLPGTQIAPLIEKLFWGCFINAGQTCAALKRLYVHEHQYEEFVDAFADYVSKIPVGNGLDAANLIGPLTNEAQRDKVASMVDEARRLGARIVTGGVKPSTPGYFYPLTVIADATDQMRVVCEEQFGPAIPILKYQTVEEAIQRANSLAFGLGGSIWGNDTEAAAAYAARLECGTAWVNHHGTLHPLAPFGGVKSCRLTLKPLYDRIGLSLRRKCECALARGVEQSDFHIFVSRRLWPGREVALDFLVVLKYHETSR